MKKKHTGKNSGMFTAKAGILWVGFLARPVLLFDIVRLVILLLLLLFVVDVARGAPPLLRPLGRLGDDRFWDVFLKAALETLQSRYSEGPIAAYFQAKLGMMGASARRVMNLFSTAVLGQSAY